MPSKSVRFAVEGRKKSQPTTQKSGTLEAGMPKPNLVQRAIREGLHAQAVANLGLQVKATSITPDAKSAALHTKTQTHRMEEEHGEQKKKVVWQIKSKLNGIAQYKLDPIFEDFLKEFIFEGVRS